MDLPLKVPFPPEDKCNLSELILLTEKKAELEERIIAENVDISIPNAYLINKDPYTEVKLPLLTTSEDDSSDSDNEDGADPSQKVPPVTPATAKKPAERKPSLKILPNTLSPKHLRKCPPHKSSKRKSGSVKEKNKRHPPSSAQPQPSDLYTFECLNDLQVCADNQNEVLSNYLYGEAVTHNKSGAEARTETEIYKEDATTGKFVKVERIKDNSKANEGNSKIWWQKPKRRNLWGNPFIRAGSTLFSHVELQRTAIPPLKSKLGVKTSNFGCQFPPLYSIHDRKIPDGQEGTDDDVEHVYDGVHIRDIGKYCPEHPLHSGCSSRIIAISKHGIVSTERSTGSSRCFIEPLIRPKPAPLPLEPDIVKKDSKEFIPPKSEGKPSPVIIKSSGELAQHLSQFTQKSQSQGRDYESSSSQDEDIQERVRRARRQRRRNYQSKRNKNPGAETLPSRTQIVQSIKEPITFTRPGFSMANFLNLNPVQRLKFMRESFKNSQSAVRG
ncbi:unnamed protein product [Allacma fusca]|uniref:Uncharacterized protein n=1 Tax=Allacma fusca TaxID=39272 RepID=A0A8J2PUQ0_9HEXA|nr:unnamed protein product [Allacma fusca]